MSRTLLHIVNAVILFAGGLIGYITQGGQGITMLAAAIAGLVLLFFTKLLKSYNQFAEHTVAAILLLLLIMFAFRVNIGQDDFDMYFLLLLVLILSCFITLASFIFGFIKEWRKGKTGL